MDTEETMLPPVQHVVSESDIVEIDFVLEPIHCYDEIVIESTWSAID